MAKINEVTPGAEPVTEIPKGYLPNINVISVSDLFSSLKEGMRDFAAAPLYGVLIGGFYALAGVFMMWALAARGDFWLIIPAAVGFPLIGPFVAVGFYEISRRRMVGESWNAKDIFVRVLARREGQVAFVGVAILCISWVWVFIARIIFAIFLGSHSLSNLWDFVQLVLTTQAGLGFLGVGSVFGGAMAYVLFSCTVVALPLLVGRDIDVMSAIVTSFKAVAKNRAVMLLWAAIIVALLFVGMVPFFLGLIFILPLLGHATWHIYTKVIDQELKAEPSQL